jgi:RHS repeat-associated protein
VDGDTTQYVLDLAATLPVVVSGTEAVYLYGLDIVAQQQSDRQYYFHDGLGSVRQLLDSTGDLEANYAYDPFGVPVVAGDASNPYRFTGEAWDEEVELLYLRARYYQPETGRFITKDPWPGDVWQPGTLNRYVYVRNNPVNGIDPGGLEGSGASRTRAEWIGPVPPPPRYDPQFGGPYIPLEVRLADVAGPAVMGGQFWLTAAVERDPLVHHVYTRLRDDLEDQLEEPGPMDMMTIVCNAVKAAKGNMLRYYPACGSSGNADCDRVAVRAALNALAATARVVNQGRIVHASPYIKYESDRPEENLRRIYNEAFPRLEGPVAPFGLCEWDPSEGSYSLEYDGDKLKADKAIHFLTHAFMAYEFRWRGVAAYQAWQLNDWQGRIFEQMSEAEYRLRGGDERYSLDDVIANRWGTAFGLAAFDDPESLVRHCTGLSCRVPRPGGI